LVLDQLGEFARLGRDGKRGDQVAEPEVGCAEQDRPRALVAGLLGEVAQVRAPAAALGHPGAPFLAERIREATWRRIAGITTHLQVARLTAGSVFDQPQQRRATRRPTMRELDPGEVIEVAILACDQEAGWNDRRLLVFITVDMEVARALGM